MIPHNTKTEALIALLDGETVKLALFNDSTAYTTDPVNHEFVSDVLDNGTTAQEFGGAGYSRKTLTTSFSTDDGDGEGVFDADDVSWSSLDGETIQGALIYIQQGGDDTTPGDDLIVAVFDDTDVADFPLPTNGSQVDLPFDPEGVINIS